MAIRKRAPKGPEKTPASLPGRKVILLPTARSQRLYPTVKSFVDNARIYGYKEPIHFVVADYTSRGDAARNKQRLAELERKARGEMGMSNIQIHHFDVWDQAKIFNDMMKDPKFRDLPEYIGRVNEAPGGYGRPRNRASALAFHLGLLDRPKDVGILFDDDILAKNLVRGKKQLGPEEAKIYGESPEGRLWLEHTGSYFGKVDELFAKNPNAKIGLGASTFDGDVPASMIVDLMLDSVDNFLTATKDSTDPKGQKLGEDLSRSVFGRKFHSPRTLDWALKNLNIKAQKSLKSKVPFSPHWIAEDPKLNKVQVVKAAHNMYVTPDVLKTYPFLPGPERGEDALLIDQVGKDYPSSVAGITNPVAHIKLGGRRSAVFADVRREYDFDLNSAVDRWEKKAGRIQGMLRHRTAWWNSPEHKAEADKLRFIMKDVNEQVRALRGREAAEHTMPPLVRGDLEPSDDYRLRRAIEMDKWGKLKPNERWKKSTEHNYRATFNGWKRMWQPKGESGTTQPSQ